jgi:hypothetical protein
MPDHIFDTCKDQCNLPVERGYKMFPEVPFAEEMNDVTITTVPEHIHATTKKSP